MFSNIKTHSHHTSVLNPGLEPGMRVLGEGFIRFNTAPGQEKSNGLIAADRSWGPISWSYWGGPNELNSQKNGLGIVLKSHSNPTNPDWISP